VSVPQKKRREAHYDLVSVREVELSNIAKRYEPVEKTLALWLPTAYGEGK
jgi:hypothetical protein